MLNQRLQQKLLQKLSPQQIQLMKMLQIPTAQLELRIKEEIEANPALEESDNPDDETQDETAETPSEESEPVDETEAPEEEAAVEDEVDMSDYYDEDDEGVADYKTEDPSQVHDPDDDHKSVPVQVASTFHEYLGSQVGMLDLDERRQQIAMHLIGSLDDDGYLRRDPDAMIDDLAFRQNIKTDASELQFILEQIQKFDPPGVGARSLEECLLLQLKRKEEPNVYTEIAIRVVEKYFDLFAKKHFDKLESIFSIDSEK